MKITGASFPVVFFNGKNEVDAGNIFLHPSLELNQFRMSISFMIGISPRHISTFLIRRKKKKKKNASSPDIRRPLKVPFDESSDFAAISLQRGCFVLATMKTSPQRARISQLRAVRPRDNPAESGRKTAAVSPPIMSILRRSPDADVPDVVMAVAAEALVAAEADWLPARILFPETENSRELCETCHAAEEDGLMPEFHPCVYDEVFTGFNTTVGPIERPSSLDGPDAVG
ncbi:hypothetical protein KSP40_PGU013064 [Platanthera guangdongensis]|uniref:DUF7138 domain-containing protein n=1 Tax=Platanthera guangdongensis TaxID=2320717 RepID=A0ABR2M6X0_9ASPA